VKVIPMCLL